MKDFLSISRIEQHTFPGAKVSYSEPPMLPNSDLLWMTSTDGTWIAGIYAPGTEKKNICVIHFYSSGETLRTSEFMIQGLRDIGLSVLCFDYRGFGASGGRPEELGFYADALFAYDWLMENHPDTRVVVSGRSLGTAVAAFLASERHVDGLMLFSPMTTVIEVVKLIFPPDEIIIEDALPFRFDTVARMANVECPVFIAHGKKDRIAPYAMSHIVEQAAQSEVYRHDLDDAGHNDLFAVGGVELWRAIEDFIDELQGKVD